MKKNKKAGNKCKTERDDKSADGKSGEHKTRIKSKLIPTQGESHKMNMVMESYYNCERHLYPDSLTTGESYTIKQEVSPRANVKHKPNTTRNQMVLQKIISKNYNENIESLYIGTKKKNSKLQRSMSKNSQTKHKFKKCSYFPENCNGTTSFAEEERAQEKERTSKLTNLMVKNKSLENKVRKKRNSGTKFEKNSHKGISGKKSKQKGKQKKNQKQKQKSTNISLDLPEDSPSLKQKTLLRELEVKRLYIGLISDICGELTLSRETYELAQYYFRQCMKAFLYEPQSLQTLVLCAIILALKVDESGAAKPLFREIIGLEKGEKATRSLDNSIKNCSGSLQKSWNREQFLRKINMHRKKINQRIQGHLKRVGQIFHSRQIYLPKKSELLEIEKLICRTLKFKLCPKTVSSSLDFLTLTWDRYITEQWRKDEILLCFRSQGQTMKLSYLIQIVNFFLLHHPQAELETQCLLLSSMYLLVRTKLEIKRNNGYFSLEMMKESLLKSTNVLYIDLMGANLLFSQFLEKVGFNMEAIAKSCMRIMPYINESLFEEFSFREDPKIKSHEEGILIHHHNPKLYSYFNQCAA